MRHPKEGGPPRASLYSKIPVINAGDGGHSHPTQTLLDMMTIRRRKGRLDNLTIGFCGDLKFGRTVHSLIKSLARYDNVKFVLISPEELRVPDYIINEVLEPRGIPYIETRNLEGGSAGSRYFVHDPCSASAFSMRKITSACVTATS